MSLFQMKQNFKATPITQLDTQSLRQSRKGKTNTMANKTEFHNFLIKDAKVRTWDYKASEGYERSVERKNISIVADWSKIKNVLTNKDGVDQSTLIQPVISNTSNGKEISFGKVDKQIYTSQDENPEEFIFASFAGKTKVLDEKTMTKNEGVEIDQSFPNGEYSHVDLNLTLFKTKEGQWTTRINAIRQKVDNVFTETVFNTFDDEDDFISVNKKATDFLDNTQAEVIEG